MINKEKLIHLILLLALAIFTGWILRSAISLSIAEILDYLALGGSGCTGILYLWRLVDKKIDKVAGNLKEQGDSLIDLDKRYDKRLDEINQQLPRINENIRLSAEDRLIIREKLDTLVSGCERNRLEIAHLIKLLNK